MDAYKPDALRRAERHCPTNEGGHVVRCPDRTSQAAVAISEIPRKTRTRRAVAHQVCHAAKSDGGQKLDSNENIVHYGGTRYRGILNYDVDRGYNGDAEPDTETEQQRWNQMLIKDLSQMMFVSGETAEPSPETTGMIEEIVRQQVVEMVSHKVTCYVRFASDLMKLNHSLLNVLPWQPVVTPALSLPTSFFF